MSPSSPLESSFGPQDLPDPEESAQLVLRAQEGDGDALNRLFSRYLGRVERIVRARLGDPLRGYLEPMDVVQDTFAIAAGEIHKLEVRDRCSILRWLAAIAAHRIDDAHDYHYAEKRNRKREVPITVGGDTAKPGIHVSHLSVDETSIRECLARAELEQRVDEAVSKLPAHYREVVLLRNYCESSWAEIAAELDRPSPAAARQLYRRAVVKLATLVRRPSGGPG